MGKITIPERSQGYPPGHPQQLGVGAAVGWGYLSVLDRSLLDTYCFPPDSFFLKENQVGIIYKLLILFELNLLLVGFNGWSLFFLLGLYRQHPGSC